MSEERLMDRKVVAALDIHVGGSIGWIRKGTEFYVVGGPHDRPSGRWYNLQFVAFKSPTFVELLRGQFGLV